MLLETVVAFFPSAKRGIVVEGDCWTWVGTTRRGVPVAYPTTYILPLALRNSPVLSARSDLPIRRVLLLIHTKGKDLPRRVPTPTCGNSKCINPEHQKWRRRGQTKKEST